MYIYDITHNQYQFPILDPDFSYLHKKCSFQIKCGAYVSTINIHPYKLFDLSKEQCQQILSKTNTHISVYNLKLLR